MHDPNRKFDNSGEAFEQDVKELYGIPTEETPEEQYGTPTTETPAEQYGYSSRRKEKVEDYY